ncbi:MAG: hypothetical protein V3T98_00220 [Candidatus Paceibacterota bacterium]
MKVDEVDEKEAKEKEVEEKIESDENFCTTCGREKKAHISGNSTDGVGETTECIC